MIMPAGRQLLLPANPRFIGLSLVFALLLHMLLGLWGQDWVPDVLAIALVFWTVHQPRKVGLVLAFFMGLMVDVHESALLGQNALSYVCISYMANFIHRRIQWFPLREQTFQVLPLFVVAAMLEWTTRLIVQDAWPHWSQLLGPLLQTALWPLLGAVLLAPQRRPFERDNIRPL